MDDDDDEISISKRLEEDLMGDLPEVGDYLSEDTTMTGYYHPPTAASVLTDFWRIVIAILFTGWQMQNQPSSASRPLIQHHE